MKTIVTVMLIFLTAATATAKMSTNSFSKEQKLLRYIDGNGNVYELKNDSIFYKPVTDPLQSSSGIYTGGTPASKALQPGVYMAAQDKFEQLITNKSIRIKKRVMGSGMLLLNDGKRDMNAIIRNGPEKDELEKYLKSLL